MNRFRRWFGPRSPPDSGAQVAALRACADAELARQTAQAQEHLSNDRWTDYTTGHNIGTDEVQALRFAQEVNLEPTDAERSSAAAYAERLLRELHEVVYRIQVLEPDPDGYGAATVGEVIRKLEAHCAEARIALDTQALRQTWERDQEWFEVERHIQGCQETIVSYIQTDALDLLFDEAQVALFLMTLKLYRERIRLGDAEIIYYCNVLIDLRSRVLGAAIGRVPRIYISLFYRYVAGISNLLFAVRAGILTYSDQVRDGLPYTAFGYDASSIDLPPRPSSSEGLEIRLPGTRHALIANGLSFLDSILTSDERGFLWNIFPDPGEILPADGGHALYHFLQTDVFDRAGKQKTGASHVLGLRVRRARVIPIEVDGWIVSETAELYDVIERVGRGATFAAQTARGAPDAEISDLLQTLSQRFVPPKGLWPREGDRLSVIAEGPMSLVPFAAFTASSGTVWSYGLPLVVGTRLSANLFDRPVWLGEAKGCVVAVSEHGDDLADLPEVVSEAAHVSSLFEWPLITGEKANAAALKEAAQGHQVLHVATHGQIRGPLRHWDLKRAIENPARYLKEGSDAAIASELRVSGAAGEGHDAFVSGGEVRTWALSGAQLVFLSVCQGAAGRSMGGEAPFGLGRAFRAAGAKQIVASLFPVADDAGRTLAEAFYEGVEFGMDPGEALVAAQRKMAGEGWGWHTWGGYQVLA